MKKVNFSKSDLFKKHENDQFDGLSTVFGGGGTQQTTDSSTSAADCTGSNCTDSTVWDTDSTSNTDSTQRHLDSGGIQ